MSSSRFLWCPHRLVIPDPPPVFGHQLEKANLGGARGESLVPPGWHSGGTSAGTLGEQEMGQLGLSGNYTEQRELLAFPRQGPGRSSVALPHQHICTALQCCQLVLQHLMLLPRAARPASCSVQQILLRHTPPNPPGLCCSQERNGY